MYAIIETGGKQYKVAPGQTIDVERLDVDKENNADLDRVLLFADDDNKIMVGTPTIEGVKVIATSWGNGKSKKVIVFRYKPKTRSRKKTGHRQPYTRLFIDSIVAPGADSGELKPVRQRKKKEVTESGT